MDYKYSIKAGEISLRTDTDKKVLDQVISFGCRENPKRHFMLINKLLGRYTPTSPRKMRDTYNKLAELVGPGETTFVVSFAEAATGLGAGVADSLSKVQEQTVYFQHTTRHALPKPVWFTLDEKHSHAVDHIFYKPEDDIYDEITSVNRLVIIDDEITTGRTIKVLLEKIVPYLPFLKEVVIASIMQLSNTLDFKNPSSSNIKVRVISIIEADLKIETSKNYQPVLPDNVNSNLSQLYRDRNFGRCGIRMPLNIALNKIESKIDSIVIADGEHQYVPFLIAEELEKTGVRVDFQSINRSPLSTCENIINKFKLNNYENNAVNYVYNFFPGNKNVFVTSELYYEGLKFHESVSYHECI